MKRLQIPQNLCTKDFTYTKKFYVHEIAAVDLSKIYLLKNGKKTCKPNNRDLNRDWITVNCKKWFYYNKTPPLILFWSFSGWWFSQFFHHSKTFWKLTLIVKVTNIASTDITFLSKFCTWRVRSSRPEEFFEKGVLNYFTNFTEKHLCHVLFSNKAAGWRPATANTKSGRGAFLWILRNL